jgi:hypothetical protein
MFREWRAGNQHVESAVRTSGQLMAVTVRATNEIANPIAGLRSRSRERSTATAASTDGNGNATFQYPGQVAGFTGTPALIKPHWFHRLNLHGPIRHEGKLESTSDTFKRLLVQEASGGWGCGLTLPGQTFQINTWK